MKTPIQKGKVVADQPTMQTKSTKQIHNEDVSNQSLRKSGSTLSLHEPKTNVRKKMPY